MSFFSPCIIMNKKKAPKTLTDFFQKSSPEASSSTSNIDDQETRSPETKRKCTFVRYYNVDYLKFGFIIWPKSEENLQKPQCVVCKDVLSNECMKPDKLLRHLKSKHPQLENMPITFFERKSHELKQQISSFRKCFSVEKSIVRASYLIALRVAKCKKPYSVAEDLIKPCLVDVCSELLGPAAAIKMKTLSLSNDTIQRRISEVSADVEYQLIRKLKESILFAIQMDESTDVSNNAVLLCYVRYIDYEVNDVKEELLCCLELESRTTSTEIYIAVNNYIENNSLLWKNCIGVCTDGAACMTGSRRWDAVYSLFYSSGAFGSKKNFFSTK